MGRRIELPQLPAGQPQEQLQALYSYLYQMAEALNGNLAEIGGNDLTDQERMIVRDIIGTGDAEEGRSEAETLKSLIIKTADFVRSELNEYRLNLLGEYVAEGKFGKYVRRTGLDVDVTPTGIQQNYTFAEIIQGLKTYEINAKNYIKTGLLRTVSSVPVYGVAIGKDIVTFSEDGTETYNDGNKVAELTADELSFWQNSNKIASYTGTEITLYSGTSKRMTIDANGVTFYNGTTKLAELLNSALKFYYNGTLRAQYDGDGVSLYNGSTLLAKFEGDRIGFYQNGTEVFYISSGKLSCNADMEINSGKTLKVAAGGTLDVDTTNFKINSADKKMVSGAWTFDDGGVLCVPAQSGYKFAIKGDIADMPAQTIGILFQNDPGSVLNWIGQMKFVIRSKYQSNNYVNMLTFESDHYGNASFYPENARVDLGKSGSKYKKLYLEELNTDSIINNGGVHTPNKLNGFVHRYAVVFDDTDSISREIGVFYDDSTGCMWLSAEPGLVVQADKVYYYDLIQRSSREIKHNIRPMENRGETLDRLRPVTFVYDEDTNEKERAGLIYEDAVEVMPEICTGDEGNKAINYVELIPMLLKEIQDLRARVKALEEREGGN